MTEQRPGSKWNLPYSRKTLDVLREHWHVHSTTYLSSGFSVAQRLNARGNSSQILDAINLAINKECNTNYEQDLRFTTATVCRSFLAVSHDPSTGETYAVLHSANEKIGSNVLSTLKHMQSYAHLSYLVPFIFTAHYLAEVEQYVNDAMAKSNTCILMLGCDQLVRKRTAETADLTDLPAIIGSLATATSNLKLTLRNVAEQIDVIEQLMAAHEDDKDAAFAAEIKARVHMMRYKCEDIEAHIGVMRETSQASTQMVRYN
jgi:hypothetical protein